MQTRRDYQRILGTVRDLERRSAEDSYTDEGDLDETVNGIRETLAEIAARHGRDLSGRPGDREWEDQAADYEDEVLAPIVYEGAGNPEGDLAVRWLGILETFVRDSWMDSRTDVCRGVELLDEMRDDIRDLLAPRRKSS